MMTKEEFEVSIHEKIPISNAFGVTFAEVGKEKVHVKAPFSVNATFKNTVFGGSLHAIATIACWSWLTYQLQNDKKLWDIVIVSSEVSYLLPVTQDIDAVCLAPDIKDWELFQKMLRLKSKGRLCLKASIIQDGEICVAYQGTFAAFEKVI